MENSLNEVLKMDETKLQELIEDEDFFKKCVEVENTGGIGISSFEKGAKS